MFRIKRNSELERFGLQKCIIKYFYGIIIIIIIKEKNTVVLSAD